MAGAPDDITIVGEELLEPEDVEVWEFEFGVGKFVLGVEGFTTNSESSEFGVRLTI